MDTFVKVLLVLATIVFFVCVIIAAAMHAWFALVAWTILTLVVGGFTIAALILD
jgi:hypothetical protein